MTTTANKRSSAVMIGLPFRRCWPFPDGTLDEGDRAHADYMYSMAAAEPPVEEVVRRGGGYPWPDERKRRPKAKPEWEKRDDEQKALERVLTQAYERIVEGKLPEVEREAVREVVRPFTRSRAKVHLPRPAMVRFDAMASEARAARDLLRIYERYIEEEEAALLLLLS